MAADAAGGKGRLEVAVLTPMGPVVTAKVDAVIAPGSLGEFGVLVGHVPFVSGLGIGVLVLRTGAERERLAVGRGFLEVSHDGTVRVLVEQAALAKGIDVVAARAEADALGAELATNVAVGAARAVLADRAAWARARVAAAAGA
ncbi:MAG: ATP synthase F1 subunit epsilon [Myxococcales bacterium]|nr:ATP synthase F1 subunit epsilon [Myxococcales bacterium]